MTQKDALEQRIRGWFPQESTISISRSTSSNIKPKNASWASCPFLVPGALMIFAALLSANFGLTIVSMYFPEGTVIHTGFYIGIFSVVGFVLSLICGGLLLAGKGIHAATAGLAVVLCFGLATVTLPILTGYTLVSCLLVASPMIAFPAVALIQIGLNTRNKTYYVIHEPQLTLENIEDEPQPINRKPVATGLAAVGLGFILTGFLSYFEAAVFSTMVNGIIIVAGACLIVAAYLERRTYKQVV